MFSFMTQYLSTKEEEQIQEQETHYKKYYKSLTKDKTCHICGTLTSASNFSNHRKTKFCKKVEELKNNLRETLL